jgi:hypothetical protein
MFVPGVHPRDVIKEALVAEVLLLANIIHQINIPAMPV